MYWSLCMLSSSTPIEYKHFLIKNYIVFETDSDFVIIL